MSPISLKKKNNSGTFLVIRWFPGGPVDKNPVAQLVKNPPAMQETWV